MNAKEVAWNLACRRSSPFFVRKQLLVVSNVSWGLLDWEADLIVCSKAGFLTEVEIKISLSDWKADFTKDKWNPLRYQRTRKMIKNFYYAAPDALARRHTELELPPHAGVIAVSSRHVEIIKPATALDVARKLNDSELLKLARLGAIKAWRRSFDVKIPVEITDDGEIVEEVETVAEPPKS